MPLVEIRYWVSRLMDDPMLGWAMDKTCLARTLGFRGHVSMTSLLWAKLRARGVAPKQQRHISDQLRLMLAGKIIARYHKVDGDWMGMAVVADKPEPLNAPPPVFGTVRVGRNGVKLTVQPRQEPQVERALPSVQQLLGAK